MTDRLATVPIPSSDNRSPLGRKAIPLLMLMTTAATTFAGWEPLPPLPEPNGGFACGALGGKVVVLGGTNWKQDKKHWLEAIWLFDPASRAWQLLGKLPQPLAYPVASEWKGELIIAGGTEGAQPHKEIWQLNTAGKLSLLGRLRQDRTLAAGGVLDDQLLVVGGTPDPAKFDAVHRNGELFQLRNSSTTNVSLPSNAVVALAAGVVSGNELFLFGGGRHDPVKEVVDLNSAWAYDIVKGTWRNLRPYPFPVRGAAAVSLDPHHLLVGGGYGGAPAGFTAATFIYDTRRDAYTKAVELPVAALVGLVVNGDFVYCLGGEDRMKHRTDICARITVKELLDAAR